jgi:hypothetical protein
MSHPEWEGPHNEQQEHEQRFEITLTESQRDALLSAIQNEINSCENELRRLAAMGLHVQQVTEDYNTITEFVARLESILTLLQGRP